MKKVGEYSWGSRDLKYSDFDFFYQYEMFACPICHKVTLRETYGDETMIEGYENPVYGNEKNILYPLNSIDSASVPEKIKNAYEAALKTKGVACTGIGVGRCLSGCESGAAFIRCREFLYGTVHT